MKYKSRDEFIEAAWQHYAEEHMPPAGFTYASRRLFIAGYLRGRASVMGFAWLYSMLVTILCTILLFFV